MVIGFTDYLLASLLLWVEASRWPRLGYVGWRQQSRQNGDCFVPERWVWYHQSRFLVLYVEKNKKELMNWVRWNGKLEMLGKLTWWRIVFSIYLFLLERKGYWYRGWRTRDNFGEEVNLAWYMDSLWNELPIFSAYCSGSDLNPKPCRGEENEQPYFSQRMTGGKHDQDWTIGISFHFRVLKLGEKCVCNRSSW